MERKQNIKKFLAKYLLAYVYLPASVFQLPFNQYELPQNEIPNQQFSFRKFFPPLSILSLNAESLFDSAHLARFRKYFFYQQTYKKQKPKCHRKKINLD